MPLNIIIIIIIMCFYCFNFISYLVDVFIRIIFVADNHSTFNIANHEKEKEIKKEIINGNSFMIFCSQDKIHCVQMNAQIQIKLFEIGGAFVFIGDYKI